MLGQSVDDTLSAEKPLDASVGGWRHTPADARFDTSAEAARGSSAETSGDTFAETQPPRSFSAEPSGSSSKDPKYSSAASTPSSVTSSGRYPHAGTARPSGRRKNHRSRQSFSIRNPPSCTSV